MSTLRPTSVKRHMVFQRKCSCCRENGHNITQCDDPRINSLYLHSEYMANTVSEEVYFRYINDIDIFVVKALCLRLRLVSTMTELNTKNIAIYYLCLEFIQNQNRIHNHITQKHVFTVKTDNQIFTRDETCPICYNDFNPEIVKYNCLHTICTTCLSETIKHKSCTTIDCSLCRAKITHIYVQSNDIQTIITSFD